MNLQTKQFILNTITKLHGIVSMFNLINARDWIYLSDAIQKKKDRLRKISQCAELGNIATLLKEVQTLLEEVINE